MKKNEQISDDEVFEMGLEKQDDKLIDWKQVYLFIMVRRKFLLRILIFILLFFIFVFPTFTAEIISDWISDFIGTLINNTKI